MSEGTVYGDPERDRQRAQATRQAEAWLRLQKTPDDDSGIYAGVLQEIRAAAGDPYGKLMIEDFVNLIYAMRIALDAIAGYPAPEQDGMQGANMRKLAQEAIK